jgi:glycosyltransferase involved in cell wall biosynthesis
MKISILNAGQENDYLYGLVSGLSQITSLEIEVVDSDNSIGLFDRFPRVKFFNLRGDNLSKQSFFVKAWRICRYYLRLLNYAVTTKAELFHIEWENSLILFDRTLLNLYYKLIGKKLIFTAHNVYKEARDDRGNIIRWLSIKCMYHIVDRIIVHTPKMKDELCSLFHISPEKIVIIRHGINNRVLRMGATKEEARRKLDIGSSAHTILFFGQIDKYKGIETLINAAALLIKKDPSALLIIAGKPKRQSNYISELKEYASKMLPGENLKLRFQFIPIDEVETYFAAADCLALPYKRIFQSGVVFLAYRFGMPIIATDVGSFREDVINGTTGFICNPDDAEDMAAKLQLFFTSDLFLQREETRARIIEFAEKKYSWIDISRQTFDVYASLTKQE